MVQAAEPLLERGADVGEFRVDLAVPTPLTAVTITMLRPAAMMQYSMAVAPHSSSKIVQINDA
jgi:hypothetical protein